MSKSLQKNETAEVLYGRFHDLLLGHNFAQQQLGYIHSLNLDYGEKLPSRTLLEVEEKAQKNRNKEDTKKLKYIAHVNALLHQDVEAQINTSLEDIDYIYNDIIHIQDNIPAILNLLSVTSASVGRIIRLLKVYFGWVMTSLNLLTYPNIVMTKILKKQLKLTIHRSALDI